MIQFILEFLEMIFKPIAYGIVEISLEVGYFFYSIFGSGKSKDDFSFGKRLLLGVGGALIICLASFVVVLAVLKY